MGLLTLCAFWEISRSAYSKTSRQRQSGYKDFFMCIFLLPLPIGERDGVRGLPPFEISTPLTRLAALATLSPREREEFNPLRRNLTPPVLPAPPSPRPPVCRWPRRRSPSPAPPRASSGP